MVVEISVKVAYQRVVQVIVEVAEAVVAVDTALTVNILVKHPRSGLPPAVLYNLSYFQLQLELALFTLFTFP